MAVTRSAAMAYNKPAYPQIARDRIKSSQLLRLLENHALKGTPLEPSRMRAAEILLDRTVPKLQSIAISGADGGAVPLYVIHGDIQSHREAAGSQRIIEQSGPAYPVIRREQIGQDVSDLSSYSMAGDYSSEVTSLHPEISPEPHQVIDSHGHLAEDDADVLPRDHRQSEQV